MKYKFYQYINANNAVRKLMAMDFDIKTSYKLYKLAKQFDIAIQFGAQRENELLAKYGGTVTQDGHIQFIIGEDEESKRIGRENMEKFQLEINDLNNAEIDEDIEPITLSLDTMENKTISPNDLMALDGFVVFE